MLESKKATRLGSFFAVCAVLLSVLSSKAQNAFVKYLCFRASFAY